jgi:hypothetical protein
LIFSFEMFGEERVIVGVIVLEAYGFLEGRSGVGAVCGVGGGEAHGRVDGCGEEGQRNEAGDSLEGRARG